MSTRNKKRTSSPKRPATGRGGESRLGRIETATWHKPLCSSCGKVIENPARAMAQWKYDERTGKNFSPVINCKVGEPPGCAGAFALRRDGSRVRDSELAWLRRSPMEAVLLALSARLDTEEERQRWAAWLGLIMGLPVGLLDVDNGLGAVCEIEDQLVMRVSSVVS